jgi:ABC-type antimicrobial peptide transport system permease subunit
MKKPATPRPPGWAHKLLTRITAPHLLEELEGDLEEMFRMRLRQHGYRKAQLFYLLDILLLVHPRLWRRKPSPYPKPVYTQKLYLDMLTHHLLLAYRSSLRYKSSFVVNLVGLSTGLACAMLIYLWVSDEMGIDKFHAKGDRLYQALLNRQLTDQVVTEHATPAPLAEALVHEMPQVAHAVATTAGIQMPLFTLTAGNKNVKAAGQFAGRDYFKMFSYPLVQGDENQVLRDKNAIVLSESLARKLFNTSQNIIGKAVVFQQEQTYLVSGVFADVPASSSDQFDFLLSFEVFKDLMGPGATNWGNTGPRTFVLLREGVDLQGFNAAIRGLIKAKDNAANTEVFLRPYRDKYLYDTYENGRLAGGRIAYVKLFSIIAFFILLIAASNFMNLSTAKASRRVKEIGIKKALGSGRGTLMGQFLGESLGMAFLSGLVALLLVVLLLPEFNQITGKRLVLRFDTRLIAGAVGITAFTGLLAGIYPAIYLSGFSPSAVLKGKLPQRPGEGWVRQGLVVLQFALSVVFIVAVTVVYQQVQFIQSRNLGYSKDNLIYFGVEGSVKEKLEPFLSAVKNLPGVVNASSGAHSFLGQQSSTTGLEWEGKNPEDLTQFEVVQVNYDMLQTLGIGMSGGRAFSREFGTDSTRIIFNEAAIKAMGMKEPVGKTVRLWGEERQIVGVSKNFHFQSLHEAVKPLFFILAPGATWNVMVKMEVGKEKETLSRLGAFYREFNPGFVFDYQFLDTDYQALYAAEKRVSVLSKYFAGLAILISCLGLYGLAAFTAQRRRKEIGIRKVLGLNEMGIVYLLVGSFTRIVAVAIGIALPLSYLLTSRWLADFAYKIDLQWWYFVGAGGVVLLVSWLTVGFQAVKAALVNPVTTLKSE